MKKKPLRFVQKSGEPRIASLIKKLYGKSKFYLFFYQLMYEKDFKSAILSILLKSGVIQLSQRRVF